MWMPLVLRKTTNNPQSRFSAPVTQEWRQDWHRILLVAHSCYRSLSRRSPAPLCHLTEPPVASNSCALSLFLEGEGGSGDELSHNLPTWTTHCNRGLFWALLQFSAVCPDQQACTLPALYSKEDNRSGKVVNRDNRERDGRGDEGGLALEQRRQLMGSLGTKRKQVTSCCRKHSAFSQAMQTGLYVLIC